MIQVGAQIMIYRYQYRDCYPFLNPIKYIVLPISQPITWWFWLGRSYSITSSIWELELGSLWSKLVQPPLHPPHHTHTNRYTIIRVATDRIMDKGRVNVLSLPYVWSSLPLPYRILCKFHYPTYRITSENSLYLIGKWVKDLN